MVDVGVAFLLEFLDNTIKNEQDIEKVLGLPVLGAIATWILGQMNTELKNSDKHR